MPSGNLMQLPIKQPRVRVDRRPDGSIVLEQEWSVEARSRSIPHLFEERAARHPDRVFVAKRRALEGGGWGDWVRLTYGSALRQVRATAQAFIDKGLGPDASVMVLCGPSPEHAVVALGAYYAGAPVTAVATAYSLLADDFAKLRHVIALCQPKLLLVDGPDFARALDALDLAGVEVVSPRPIPGRITTRFQDLIETAPTAGVDTALESLTHDTVARYVFTSGSTGAPKAVIHTQGTFCAQIASRNALMADASHQDNSVRLGWKPWNHIGEIIHLHYAIEDAGAYYIDEGRPVPGQFGETLRNLKEVIPAEFNSVPIFYGHLVEALEKDPVLCRRFFENVHYFTYGSAALSQDVFDRVQTLAEATIGRRAPFFTKYGTTEVQAVTHSGRPLERTGEMGIPYPGASIKLVPQGDRLEIRVKGEMVTPGYLGGPELNEGVFDEEGYYRSGDAAAFVDPADPARGLVFDGRVTENFKLSSGTWVSVGSLRLALIVALAPLAQDAVIAGHNRDEITVMVWPKAEYAAVLADRPPGTPLAELVSAPGVRAFVAERLGRHNTRARGSSLKVARVILLEEPPVGDEQAEKGYINQRGVLKRRAEVVDALYAAPSPPEVILPAEAALEAALSPAR